MTKQKQTDPVVPMIRVSPEIKAVLRDMSDKSRLPESTIVREILHAVLIEQVVQISYRSPLEIKEPKKED